MDTSLQGIHWRSLALGIATSAWLATVPAAARAAEVTIAIDGAVTSVVGDYAVHFDDADRVVGSLIFDDAVADTQPASDVGIYPGALVSLTASIPGLASTWHADDGNVSAYPDTPVFGDQLLANSFINDPTGPPINGYPIRSVGLILFGDDLLSSDALPGSGAHYEFGNLMLDFQDDFGTVVGQATIVFAPEPARDAAAVAALAGLVIAARRIARGVSTASG
jgi:hypothetical protein